MWVGLKGSKNLNVVMLHIKLLENEPFSCQMAFCLCPVHYLVVLRMAEHVANPISIHLVIRKEITNILQGKEGK